MYASGMNWELGHTWYHAECKNITPFDSKRKKRAKKLTAACAQMTASYYTSRAPRSVLESLSLCCCFVVSFLSF